MMCSSRGVSGPPLSNDRMAAAEHFGGHGALNCHYDGEFYCYGKRTTAEDIWWGLEKEWNRFLGEWNEDLRKQVVSFSHINLNL
jgi:hypothetical protein